MKFRLSGAFGELSPVRDGAPHTGIDLAMPTGTQLRSIGEGVIEKICDYGPRNIGKGVIIRLEDGRRAIYGHMSQISVHKGQHVDAGQLLGLSGSTGHSSGPHLHFGLTDASGKVLDPTAYAEDLAAISGDIENPSVFMDHLHHIIGIVKGHGSVDHYNPELAGGWFWRMIGSRLAEGADFLWHSFVQNLPDLVGYGAMATGAFVILGSMIGKGGMMRPLAIFVGGVIIAICILEGV